MKEMNLCMCVRFQPQEFVGTFSYTLATPGTLVPLPTTPSQFLQAFIRRDLLTYFIYMTNLYADQCLRNSTAEAKAEWDEGNLKEMAQFLGLSMLMGSSRPLRLKCIGRLPKDGMSPPSVRL